MLDAVEYFLKSALGTIIIGLVFSPFTTLPVYYAHRRTMAKICSEEIRILPFTHFEAWCLFFPNFLGKKTILLFMPFAFTAMHLFSFKDLPLGSHFKFLLYFEFLTATHCLIVITACFFLFRPIIKENVVYHVIEYIIYLSLVISIGIFFFRLIRTIAIYFSFPHWEIQIALQIFASILILFFGILRFDRYLKNMTFEE